MSDTGENGSGVWTSIKRIAATALVTAQNRVELFAVELHIEKCRLVEIFLLAATVTALGMTALALVTFTVVILFWENGRIAALVCLSVFYAAGAAVAWFALRSRLKSPSAFTGTIEELKKDQACLESNH